MTRTAAQLDREIAEISARQVQRLDDSVEADDVIEGYRVVGRAYRLAGGVFVRRSADRGRPWLRFVPRTDQGYHVSSYPRKSLATDLLGTSVASREHAVGLCPYCDKPTRRGSALIDGQAAHKSCIAEFET